MSRRAINAMLRVMCALNVIALVVNVSLPSRAAVGGMNSEQLVRDPDFARALQSIAEACAVNIDLGKLKC
jgi:hypothetical protein